MNIYGFFIFQRTRGVSVPISFRGVFRIELNIYDKTSLGKEFAILKDIAILP